MLIGILIIGFIVSTIYTFDFSKTPINKIHPLTHSKNQIIVPQDSLLTINAHQSDTPHRTPKKRPVLIVPELKPEELIVYETVEESVSFIGGEESLRNFMDKNLIYPEMELEEGLQYRSILRLLINPKGEIDHYELSLKPPSPGFKYSIDYLVNKMSFKMFRPARKNGKAVYSYFEMPIYFRIKD